MSRTCIGLLSTRLLGFAAASYPQGVAAPLEHAQVDAALSEARASDRFRELRAAITIYDSGRAAAILRIKAG